MLFNKRVKINTGGGIYGTKVEGTVKEGGMIYLPMGTGDGAVAISVSGNEIAALVAARKVGSKEFCDLSTEIRVSKTRCVEGGK